MTSVIQVPTVFLTVVILLLSLFVDSSSFVSGSKYHPRRMSFGRVRVLQPHGILVRQQHPQLPRFILLRGGSTNDHDNEATNLTLNRIPTAFNNTQLQQQQQSDPSFEVNILGDQTNHESSSSVTNMIPRPVPCQGQEDNDKNDVEYQRALTKTILTVTAACLFGVGIMTTRGVSSGYEFFAGYLIEQSLSIDNLFVFLMLFDYFKVPMELQNRVLSWGIGGAILLRGLMIGVGVAALQKFRSVILVFAGILIASSVNLLLEKGHNEDEHGAEPGENMVMKFTRFLFPHTCTELHGEDFFVQNETGKMIATPLLLCLVCVELSDFVFAVDSIPAVLGVSKDPLIVYASNIFAIMALRSLYTVLAKAVSNFHYLKPAVALVLGFVGIKMVGEYYHYAIGTGLSLVVICTILGGAVAASIWENHVNWKKGVAKEQRAQA